MVSEGNAPGRPVAASKIHTRAMNGRSWLALVTQHNTASALWWYACVWGALLLHSRDIYELARRAFSSGSRLPVDIVRNDGANAAVRG